MAWFSGPGSSGGGRHHSSSSYSRRRPRDGYIERMLYKVKKMIRDLWYYARRNPVKVFMMVIMPLVTGGALTKVLQQFGIRLPPGMFGGAGKGRGGGMGGGFESYAKNGANLSNLAGLAAGGGGVGSLIKLAQMFM